MKKIFMMSLVLFLLTGCGSDKKNYKYQGVAEKVDFASQGKAFLAKGDVVKAVQSFEQAIQKDPKAASNYLILGEIFLQLKEYPRAADVFSSAAKVDPANGEAYYFLSLSRAMQIQGSKEPPQALLQMRKEAILAAQRSVLIFKKQNNVAMLEKAAVLLKNLLPNTPPAAEASAKPMEEGKEMTPEEK